jgi:hypothetical protein
VGWREVLIALSEGHDVEVSEAVDPAGGLGVSGVDELDAAVGDRQTGLHHGNDDFAGGEHRFHFGGGVEDIIFVGAGGDESAVQDGGVIFVGGSETGAGENVGDERPE